MSTLCCQVHRVSNAGKLCFHSTRFARRRAREITEGGNWTTLFNSAPDNNSAKGPGKKQKKQQQQQRKASKVDKKKDRSTAKPSPAPAPPKQEHLQQQQQPGEQKPYRVRDCAYFVKHGTCKYGDSCKFRHPQSVAIAPTEKPDEYDARMAARDEKKKKATERRKARRKLAKNAKKEDSEEIQQS